MIYKYKVIEITNHSKELEDVLNDFGRLGYRLANFLEIDGHLQLTLELKKDII